MLGMGKQMDFPDMGKSMFYKGKPNWWLFSVQLFMETCLSS